MAGGRGVEQDEVGHAGPFQLLDLAQDQDVLDAGGSGGHHLDQAGLDQALGDATQAVLLQVLDQGDIGRERPGPYARGQDLLVVLEVLGTESGGQPGLALHLDDEHREPQARGHAGHGGRDRGLAHPALAGHHHDP